MIKNYIKTAWRNLLKNKFYTAINILGLTTGLTVGILILLWVQDETTFDSFHKKSADIYRLENRVGTGGSIQIWENTAAPIGVLAKKELSQVKDVARLTNNFSYALFKYKDKVFNEEHAAYTDPSFFTMFDFKLIQGNNEKPFVDNNSVIVTETTAKKYFGDDNPIGKVITADDTTSFTVTGVIKDFPKNSSIKKDMFFPMSLLAKNMYTGRTDGRNIDNDFNQFMYETYLQLQPNTSVAGLPEKLKQIHLRVKADDTDVLYLLQSLPSMHLYKADGTDGGIGTVKMFIIIALLILVIACINYVNLSTARSMLRAKEVSMRKIVGAGKMQLFMQFIVETALLFLLATTLAIGLMFVLMPSFNHISGKELVFDLADFHIWKVILITMLATLAASSIYPAFLLSSFEPLKALKGKVSARISDAVFRKVLVVLQFSFSIALIAGTFIIGKQLHYIRSKQLGYDKENVFGFFMRPGMQKHFDAVKADLLKQPGITQVTRASGNIVQIGYQTGDNYWDGKGKDETMMVRPIAIDNNFLDFFKMKLQSGNNFTGSQADSMHFILNETAVQAARIKDPIGKKFKLWNVEGTIIGVIKDFHLASMKNKIEPAVLFYAPQKMGAIYIKTTGEKAPQAIAAAEKQWKSYSADFPFTYMFLDEVYNNMYKSEQRTGSLFNVFALIAIVISCLGLFGLAAYTAQVRTKEIGVRKVLGASVSGIIQLLAADFIKLVLIAIVIATPVAWYMMNKWLQDFAYKTNIGWMVFVFAGLAAIAIAVITISVQAIKAAIANPVKSLRTE
ncbi:ABC transporter permease [Ferruginibacter sp. SUN106]|uniref:ABC transporter permease n=1 Tax=Ferruginibacter sp. SUN106 TaxID=2978348 RepID=UPI003D36A6A7